MLTESCFYSKSLLICVQLGRELMVDSPGTSSVSSFHGVSLKEILFLCQLEYIQDRGNVILQFEKGEEGAAHRWDGQ